MIKIENLVKTFGAKRAVDGVSFSVERGEVLGFLGPNGAGKSTTMRMVTGFMPPTSGKVSIGGHDVAESPLEAKRLIGYLPENAASYPDMTVQGFLNFAAELRGLEGGARKKAVGRVVELCFLHSVLNQSIDTLSKGYKHRTCLAQALIHDPQVLIMDEPTDGLDEPEHGRNLVASRQGQGSSSRRLLEEVDTACTRDRLAERSARRAENERPRQDAGDRLRPRFGAPAKNDWLSWVASRSSTARSASIRKTSPGRASSHRRSSISSTCTAGRWKACTASAASSTRCSAASRFQTL
jgi:ABC-2 type transport system ATP-binding protein